MFQHTDRQIEKIHQLITDGRRDVPNFYDEEDIEVIYVPVDGGHLRVFHHIPKKNIGKRPIFFLSGYIAAASAWADFHRPHQGLCEYYYLETREKKSSKIKRGRKTRLDIYQSSKDLGEVIKYLGLDKREYILVGSSYGGGVIFRGAIEKLVKPSTTIAFDPIVKWVYTNKPMLIFLAITPSFILNIFRTLLAKFFLRKEQNEAQKRRMIAFVQESEPWKFKKCTIQNRKLNFFHELKEIESELFIAHGPLDKNHPRFAYYDFVKEIPKGRFIFLNTADEDRELLAGVIAIEFAMVEKKDEVPESIAEFEIKVR